jgi:hypothetical protein
MNGASPHKQDKWEKKKEYEKGKRKRHVIVWPHAPTDTCKYAFLNFNNNKQDIKQIIASCYTFALPNHDLDIYFIVGTSIAVGFSS